MCASSSNKFTHRTSLGQNFLVNKEVIRRSVERAEIGPEDVVLEVGLGKGVLTSELLASPAAYVHGVEIDERLGEWLTPMVEASNGRLLVHWGDVMGFDLSGFDPLPSKMVANIPYNITTPLIWKVLEELAPSGRFGLMILLVQKEAADRLVARPCTKERYPLGIVLELMGSARAFMRVSPGSFVPAPKVFSNLVAIEVVRNFGLANDGFLRNILRAGFAQRRKKLVNNLVNGGLVKDRVVVAMEEAGIKENARAEELEAGQWMELRERLLEG